MFRTLTGRLFFIVAAVTLSGLGIVAWVMLRMHAGNLEEQAVQGALRLSDTVRRSTRSSMLKNRKEDVYEIIRTVGDQQGIERIRIYNKEGVVRFSTNAVEQGSKVDTDAEACTRCHIGDEPVSRLESRELTRDFTGDDGNRVLGLITPVYNEAACAGASCHAAPAQQQILGVLDLQISMRDIDAAMDRQHDRFLYLTYGLMLAIATACGLFIWRFVHTPVRRLIDGTEEIARGNLTHQIEVTDQTEIGRLARSFNAMGDELVRARGQLTEWARTLEDRVREKTQTLQEAQVRLVQSEKLASLGSLSAAVAHEINNPLSGVLTYARLSRKAIKKPGPVPAEKLEKYLETIEHEVARCGKIVRNLLEFSRQSDMTVDETDVAAIIDRASALIRHRMELQGIAFEREIGGALPRLRCDADQIQQAILALFINAIEATDEGGTLTVSAESVASPEPAIELRISDTGVGIPEENLPRLFEPFFTTKQEGNGVGLGLSVVYGIVKRHSGDIRVESVEGQGTTFIILLPLDADIETDPAAIQFTFSRDDDTGSVDRRGPPAHADTSEAT